MSNSGFHESQVRQSYYFSSGNNNIRASGFVSDSTGYLNMRQSMIQNLPNYKKSDLGENPSFVVVFQAIEIERLTVEVQVLRMRQKQYERDKFNSQNYEVQIRQLTERCFAYEKQREDYRDELDKLNKICETLYHENQMLKKKLQDTDFTLKQKYESEKQKNSQLMQDIQKWKARYQAAEKSKMKQLEDLRNLMECQRKSMVDRQIRQITIRFQTERSNLQNQIRKCRQMLENRNREIDDYKQRCQKYEIQLMELKNYENIIADNQNKIVLVNQELLRLNQVLRNKDDQLQSVRQRQNRLKQLIHEQKEWEYNNQQLKGLLQNKQRQIEEWKVRVSRLEDEASRGKQLLHYNDELKNKLNLSAKQIERLGHLLQQKMEQVEQWKRQYAQKEMEASKFENAKNELASLDSKLRMLQTENQRINGIMKSRLSEIDEWKQKYYELQKHLGSMNNLDKERKALEDKYAKQIKLNEELEFNLAKTQKSLGNYRNYENLFKEHERKNALLTKEVERLNNLVRAQNDDLNDFRTKYTRLQTSLREYKDVQSHLKDYQNKIALLTQEIERLNNLMRTKNQDIDALQKEKLQLHQKMTHYRNYQLKASENEQNVQRLEAQIGKHQRDIEAWQNKFRQAEQRCRELDNQLFTNTQQRQKLSTMIRNKNNEYDALRSRFSNLEDDARKISQLEMVCQQQHNQISTYISDIESLQRNFRQVQEQLQRQRNVNNQFACKIIILSAQIQRFSKSDNLGSKKSKQFLQLQQNFSRVQSKVLTKNNEIQVLMNKINYLQSQIANLTKQFNRLLIDVQRGDQQHAILMKKIDQYQDYANRIHILGAQLDRLTEINRKLDQDARKMRLKYANQIDMENKEESFNLHKVLMAVQVQALRQRLEKRQMDENQMRKSILDPVRKI